MRIRLMVADDQPYVRSSLRALLEKEPGVEVVGEARDGAEATRLAAKLMPDMVVMDLSMPEVGGVEATRRILERAPGTMVIGLSMYTEEKDEAAIRGAGAVGFVSKAGPAAALLEAVREAAESHFVKMQPVGQVWGRRGSWVE